MALKPHEVDISPWLVRSEAGGERSPAALQIAQSLVKNMKDIGVVTIKNHGYDSSKISETFDKLMEFFKNPEEEKIRYKRTQDIPVGYHPLRRARNQKPGLQESFNFNVKMMKQEDWPEDLAPNIQQVLTEHIKTSYNIATSIYVAIAVGMGIKDEECFTRSLSGHDTNVNLRGNHYVPSPETEEGQFRVGEHQDGSSMVLLFVDGNKGLQVQLSDGSWVDGNYAENDVLLLCGTLMEVWTADAIKAVKHRVVVPEGPERLVSRSSMATFIDPDPDCLVHCVDGSNKYEPTTFWDHAMKVYQGAQVNKVLK